VRLLAAVGRYGLFVGAFLRAWRRHGLPPGQALAEAWRIGVASLPILLVISTFVGTNLALQGYDAFTPLGAQHLVGMFVGLAGVRELAPILAGSMVAAKAGTEMASQIGVMRIGQQIDALEVMAVNPLAWLIGPRLVGILLVLPPLTVIATATTIGAAYAVSVHQLDIPGYTFLQYAAEAVEPRDFLWGSLKGLLFGVVICTVSCYQGFTCERGPEGVGAATNRAVVLSAVLCVALNYFVSELVYGGGA
jgi:phospholipid/cholesterol/gamma-HCH transport system permease protein